MTKKRLYQILSILLFPYTEIDFNKEGADPIENIRYHFFKLYDRDKYTQKKKKLEYDKYERELVAFLQMHTELYPNTLDDFRMILNFYFPEDEIATIYVQDSYQGIENVHAIERYYLHNIYRIATSLLTFRDGKIAIRTWVNPKHNNERDIFDYPNVFDKVEVWNQLSRIMTPDIFIVAFFQIAGLNKPQQLYRQNGSILMSDKVLEKVLQKGIAETHVHLNACVSYEIYWKNVMNIKRWEKVIFSEKEYNEMMKKDGKDYFPIALFRILAASFLEQGSEGGFRGFLDNDIHRELMDYLYQGAEIKYQKKLVLMYGELLETLKMYYGSFEGDDFLLETIYKNSKGFHVYSEMIFLQQCLNYLCTYSMQDFYFLHLFFQYIRTKNYFFKNIVQSNQILGLSNFRLYYGKMTKSLALYLEEERLDAIFKSISHNVHLKKLEVRTVIQTKILPDEKKYEVYQCVQSDLKIAILKSIKVILAKYQEYILQVLEMGDDLFTDIDEKTLEDIDERVNCKNLVVPSIGIIFHFLKRDYVDNRISDSCWIKREPYSDNFIRVREQMVVCAKAIEELRSSIPLLSEYIVGIDAASEENKVEPWVFAPVYAEIRNKKITKPFFSDTHLQNKEIINIGFTYHVGEEFRHVLSGLRHVDEVIRFFHYKAGDRLGHAIVLGIDIDKWVARNEVVVLPVIEYLEDLLWLWGCIVRDELTYNISLSIIEDKILELAKEIYGEILGITPNMMYDAYVEKFHCNHTEKFSQMKKYILESPSDNNRHFCKYYDIKSPYGIVWTKEKILCTQFCPLFYQKFQKPIPIHINKSLTELMKTAQEYVVKKVELKGIYVETNPTSNLAIAGIDNMQDSHIFHLNSKNLTEGINHEVMATINSDDPTIFNTTSENELAYIYHALISKGYGRESVLGWIDKIRQHGMDSSFIKHEKKPSQQLMEIHQLIDSIEVCERVGGI